MAGRDERILFVGGLSEEVTEELLQAAFVPFGPVKQANIPINYSDKGHRGFGFVEFEDEEDAREALENMDGATSGVLTANEVAPWRSMHPSLDWEGNARMGYLMADAELFGRVLHVKVARPMQASMGSRRAVWADADQWYQESLGAGEGTGEQQGNAGLGGSGPTETRPLENALRPAVAGVGAQSDKQ